LWTYGSHDGYKGDDSDYPLSNTGTEAGDLSHGMYLTYDALKLWSHFAGQNAEPSFSCVKSQWSENYLGETCDINADCCSVMGLSCGYNDEDPIDSEVKTCIETARCGTYIDDTAWWECDSAIKIAVSAALLLTVTVSSI